MIREDDLEVGMWVALSEYKGAPKTKFGMFGPVEIEPVYDGVPLKIVAVSLPFVCLDDGKHRASIDVRLWSFVRVSPAYARAYNARSVGEVRGHGLTSISSVKKRRKRLEANRCPRCGERLKELMRERDLVWRRVCDCGYWEEPPGNNPVLGSD